MPAPQKQLVVFDFDHTLYDGDSGSHLFAWLIRRNPLRALAALLATPLLGPMLAWLPTRRRGISGYVWIGTFGLRNAHKFDAWIERYVHEHAAEIRARLLPKALDVFAQHRAAGDTVVVATGAPPELARGILGFVAHADVRVIGTRIGRKCGAMVAVRHCHAEEKMRMLREAGYADIDVAYSDSSADLPLLKAARHAVVVNPKRDSVEMFRRVLPAGTPILNWGCKSRGGDS